MGLFDFFKRNKKEKSDFENETDLLKIISRGISFEDTKQFLEWGTPIEDLAKTIPVKEKRFADRTIYNWGEHSILNGLKLELITMFWNHREESQYKIFNSIDFWSVGDAELQSIWS